MLPNCFIKHDKLRIYIFYNCEIPLLIIYWTKMYTCPTKCIFWLDMSKIADSILIPWKNSWLRSACNALLLSRFICLYFYFYSIYLNPKWFTHLFILSARPTMEEIIIITKIIIIIRGWHSLKGSPCARHSVTVSHSYIYVIHTSTFFIFSIYLFFIFWPHVGS